MVRRGSARQEDTGFQAAEFLPPVCVPDCLGNSCPKWRNDPYAKCAEPGTILYPAQDAHLKCGGADDGCGGTCDAPCPQDTANKDVALLSTSKVCLDGWGKDRTRITMLKFSSSFEQCKNRCMLLIPKCHPTNGRWKLTTGPRAGVLLDPGDVNHSMLAGPKTKFMNACSNNIIN